VESFGLASSAIGSITPGMALFAVTRGQWSMIDAILHVQERNGTVEMTWQNPDDPLPPLS
jgi:hypothetical protein